MKIYQYVKTVWHRLFYVLSRVDVTLTVQGHRRIAGGAWGCCSTPKLLEKSEIFRLSEILRRRSEIFITYLYTKTHFLFCKNVLLHKLRSAKL